ncbi:MAG: D-hexose-6-phosphate mutarotase [Deltaproteobacteria bacterium]|nr:D-hexose-6-phosphate mutarotase [Deltaproteobacteria bacterium]
MPTLQSLEDLNAHHVVKGATWTAGPAGSGGPVLEIDTEQCTARVCSYAAHVATWNPKLGLAGADVVTRPGLFCSPKTFWGAGKAIRGGVPICWPWFGGRTDDPKPEGKASPAHGFARTRPWFVESVTAEDNGRIEVTFLLVSDDDTLAIWPHAFEARLVASLGTSLNLTLEVKNVDDAAFDYEAALHTYLTVSDVEKIKLVGLEGTTFLDKVDGGKEKQTGREPLTLSTETDRVFLNTKSAVVVDDPGLSRQLRIEKTGSSATVVWNPWLVKATAMTDLGGDAWRSFVCVEAANVRPTPVPLSPGATHAMSTRITVIPTRSLES